MTEALTLALAAYVCGGLATFAWFRKQREYLELLRDAGARGVAPWRAAGAMLLVTLVWWPMIPACGLLRYLARQKESTP